MENKATTQILNQALNKLISAYEDLQQENGELKSKIEKLQIENEDLKNSLTNLNNDNTKQAKDITSMFDKIESLLGGSKADKETKKEPFSFGEESNSETVTVQQQTEENIHGDKKIDLNRMESLLKGFGSR